MPMTCDLQRIEYMGKEVQVSNLENLKSKIVTCCEVCEDTDAACISFVYK